MFDVGNLIFLWSMHDGCKAKYGAELGEITDSRLIEEEK